jgi:hypothetical protein
MSGEDQALSQESWGEFRAMVAGPNAKTPKARTVAGRADYESHGRRPRGRKPGARRIKMTIKVTPEFKARLEAVASDRDVAMAEILEQALALLEAK